MADKKRNAGSKAEEKARLPKVRWPARSYFGAPGRTKGSTKAQKKQADATTKDTEERRSAASSISTVLENYIKLAKGKPYHRGEMGQISFILTESKRLATEYIESRIVDAALRQLENITNLTAFLLDRYNSHIVNGAENLQDIFDQISRLDKREQAQLASLVRSWNEEKQRLAQLPHAPAQWSERPASVKRRGTGYVSPSAWIAQEYTLAYNAGVLSIDDIEQIDANLAKAYRDRISHRPVEKLPKLRPPLTEADRALLRVGALMTREELQRAGYNLSKAKSGRKASPQ